MYEKYTDGKRLIYATNRAYEVLYKRQGFKKTEDELIGTIEQPIIEDKGDSNIISIDDITKAEISEILSQKGIEYNPKDKKEVLYALMVEGD